VNRVSASAKQLDPNPANNTDVLEFTDVLQVDLAVIKSGFPDPVMAGNPLRYSVIVANNGPQDAPAVVVEDVLPTNVVFDSVTSTQGSCNEAGGTVTCELGNLPVDALAVVTITVAAPNAAVAIDKTMSLDGQCPGSDEAPIGDLEQPVTLCYHVTNTGDTDLDVISITDTAKTPSGTMVIFTTTETSATNPNLPLTPGERVMLSHTLDTNIPILCNDQEVTVTAKAVGVIENEVSVHVLGSENDLDPDNSSHTEQTHIAGGTVQGEDLVEAPCKGVDWRLFLPALDTDECETWVQVQNVGDQDTKVRLEVRGGLSRCQAGVFLGVLTSGVLRPGGTWSFTNVDLRRGAVSGVVTSQDPANPSRRGEPLSVIVGRTCPDPIDPSVYDNAAYVGISSDRLGVRDPRTEGFAYYAPIVWADFRGMHSVLHIQNAGNECTRVELWFQYQGDCVQPVVAEILSLAPYASYPFDPNLVVGPGWQGSVWLSASQPLAIVVDTLGANHFGSYHAVPADVHFEGGSGDFSLGTQVNYAPLIYREHQGWESSIVVQNLDSIHNAKVKVYFLDQSGDIIRTVVNWICPRGSQTFFLPVIAGLPGNWIGSARIDSQDWLSPGDPAISAPRILSVVILEQYTDPARVSRQETIVYNALQEMGAFDWQRGPGQATGFSGSRVLAVPFVARGYGGVSTELAIQNLNPNPGFTDFVILLYDPNQFIDFYCQKLSEKQVEYIDFNTWDVVPPGFQGALVISALYSSQQGGAALGAVAVERVGGLGPNLDVPGDESRAFEASPLFHRFHEESPVHCPGQP